MLGRAFWAREPPSSIGQQIWSWRPVKYSMHRSETCLCVAGMEEPTDVQSGPKSGPGQAAAQEKSTKTAGDGGEGGIRTPDGLAPMPHFECGAFNHSATSPRGRLALFKRGRFIAAVSAAGKGFR